MFDISFGEIFVVLVVAACVTSPKDYPKILAKIRGYYRTFQAWQKNMLNSLNQVADEFEIDDISKQLNHEAKELNKHMRQVVDLDGNLREAYDIRELEKIKQFNASITLEKNSKDIVH